MEGEGGKEGGIRAGRYGRRKRDCGIREGRRSGRWDEI